MREQRQAESSVKQHVYRVHMITVQYINQGDVWNAFRPESPRGFVCGLATWTLRVKLWRYHENNFICHISYSFYSSLQLLPLLILFLIVHVLLRLLILCSCSTCSTSRFFLTSPVRLYVQGQFGRSLLYTHQVSGSNLWAIWCGETGYTLFWRYSVILSVTVIQFICSSQIVMSNRPIIFPSKRAIII